MNASQALHEVRDALEDRASFLDTFEPEDRTDGEGNDRLFAYREEHALSVLAKVIKRATVVAKLFSEFGVEGYYDADEQERLYARREVALDALASALGRKF